MALVVFMRGVNVGGHRRIRTARLAERLRHLDAVNVGATGILVIPRTMGRGRLRHEIARRLPFEAEMTICEGREIARLAERGFPVGPPARPEIVRFVSILSRIPRSAPPLPRSLPPGGRWLVRILARDGRFVSGLHRREMAVIGHLGSLDRIFGVRCTTRSWTTMEAIARALAGAAARRRPRRG